MFDRQAMVDQFLKRIDTDPKVLLEIADLRQKYGAAATAISRDAYPSQEHREPRTIRDLWNEVDFLRALIASALRRMNSDAENRQPRQLIMDLWMLAISLLLLYALFGRP